MIEGVENYDLDGFSSACADFNKIKKIDPWMTSMLLKVGPFSRPAADADASAAAAAPLTTLVNPRAGVKSRRPSRAERRKAGATMKGRRRISLEE